MKFKDLFFILLFTFSIFSLGLSYGNVKQREYQDYVISEAYFSYELYTNVSCKSNSMGNTMNCNDKLFLDKFNLSEDKVFISNIYIYNRSGVNVVHRLIGCIDYNCSKMIFKGDNNVLADNIVNRSQLLYKVIGVQYK